MSVRFDHTLVASRDKHASARFFADIFGLPDPEEAGFFVSVTLYDGVVLSYAQLPPDMDFPGQHYAFLVDDNTFDSIVARIQARGIPYWADPQMKQVGQINTNHGGRGVYFDDPNGHHLEALTRRYGSDTP
jgi:catechol 2,3-dioxygenase-like lactoylglutathione lyase family enzyme